MRPLTFILPCLLLACSGSDFGVAGESDGSIEDSSADSASTDSGSTDSSSTDSATSDSSADTADTCVKNACGGCTALVGMPGDPCPSCGGKLVCNGTDKLECNSTVPKNACGGCSMLAVPVDSPCGVCMTGKVICDGTDATKCADPVTGPAPMSTCGTCGTKKVICDATAMGGTRCEGDDANACGGCGTLSPALGGTCGVCTSGTYVCDATTKGTKCNDPVPAGSPKVGDACGTCKTLKYACSADKKSVVCPADDVNECGGCTKLTNKPGASCGACGGKYACSGTDATKCSDTNPVPLATKCGTYCSASSYMCSSGQTVCIAPDDRKDGTDALCSSKTSPIYSLFNGKLFSISFTTQRIEAITGFTVALFTYDESVGSPVGTVRFRLIKGTPTTTPAAADVLATINVPGDKILPELSVTLPTPTAVFPAGTAMYVEVQENSYAYNYAFAGGAPATPSKTDLHYPSSSATGYDTYTDNDPFLKVSGTGCGFP